MSISWTRAWILLGLAVAGYGLGLGLYAVSDRMVSPIWPVLGIGYGMVLVYGARCWWAIWGAGLMMMMFFGTPRPEGAGWLGLLGVPVVDALGCVFSGWLARKAGCEDPAGDSRKALVAFFLIPIVSGMIGGVIMLQVIRWSGIALGDDPILAWSLVTASRIAGAVSLVPASFHLLRGEMAPGRQGESRVDNVSALLFMLVLSMAGFLTGPVFTWPLPEGAAIYLPFIGMLLVGLFCTPAVAALALTMLSLLVVVFTVTGFGPLKAGPSAASHFLVAAYLAGMGGMSYLLATGSSSLHAQARMLDQISRAGGFVPWKWGSERGFRALGDEFSLPMPPMESGKERNQLTDSHLRWLGWQAGPSSADAPAAWRQIIEWPTREGGRLYECHGWITASDPTGQPLEAIGVLQDLSESRQFQAARVELAYQKERLRGLQAQLNPHFLFNSLNTVRALIGLEPEAARLAVTGLSSILRATLKFEERDKVPLREELRVIRHFLRLQHLRHRDRLRSRTRVTRQAAICPVPPLLVLNLVENAILHGIDKLQEGGMINVDCRCDDRFLHIRVTNPSPGVDGDRVGIGIENTRQRLAILYGPEAGFQLGRLGNGLVLAHATIPLYLPGHESPRH